MFRIGQHYGMRRKELISATGEIKEITSYFKILNLESFPDECFADIRVVKKYEDEGEVIMRTKIENRVRLDANMFQTGQLWRISEVNFKTIVDNMCDNFKNLCC